MSNATAIAPGYRFEQPIGRTADKHHVTISTYLDWEKNDEWTWYASMNKFFKAVIVRNDWVIYVCDQPQRTGTFPKGTSTADKFQYVQRAFTILMQSIN
jgi:hypothetical protein